MTSVGAKNINEKISLTGREYSFLKDEIKDDECGWAQGPGRRAGTKRGGGAWALRLLRRMWAEIMGRAIVWFRFYWAFWALALVHLKAVFLFFFPFLFSLS
jgi:hypothetical protein